MHSSNDDNVKNGNEKILKTKTFKPKCMVPLKRRFLHNVNNSMKQLDTIMIGFKSDLIVMVKLV
jgi:hypothetical protein